MSSINDISAELKSMGSALADMSRQMPYSAPAGYLENFGAAVQETISSLETDPVLRYGKTMPYTAPSGYFGQLTDKITANALYEEISLSLTKITPLKAPGGYFEALPEKVLHVAKASGPEKETRQIPFRPAHSFPPVRWAAAAVLLICISLGSYITFFTANPAANPEKILASVSNTEIQDYFQHDYRMDATSIVTSNDISNIHVDNKDIIEYLDENGWE